MIAFIKHNADPDVYDAFRLGVMQQQLWDWLDQEAEGQACGYEGPEYSQYAGEVAGAFMRLALEMDEREQNAAR